MATRKKSKAQLQLDRLDEELRRIPRPTTGHQGRGLDPDKLMQSIEPRPRRRRGSRTLPSQELVDAAAKIVIERVKRLLKKGGAL
jgi:hypothetical protein